MRLPRLGLAFISVLALTADTSVMHGAPPLEVQSQFKLKAGGQVDLEGGTLTMAGQMSHVGQFTCEGTFDAATWTFYGTLTDRSGDTANFDMTLVAESDGVYTAIIVFSTQSTHNNFIRGVGSGLLRMDQDFMFTVEIEGPIYKVPCPANSCLG